MDFIGLLRTLEQITRPPRRGAESEDGEPVGAILCGGPGCDGECCKRTDDDDAVYDEPTISTASSDELIGEIRARFPDAERVNPAAPGLTPDELVGVRGLLQERYVDSIFRESDDPVFDTGVETGHDTQHTKTVGPPRRCHARKPNQAPNMVTICDEWAGHDGQHRHGQSEFWPNESSASNPAGTAAEPAPSPTIVQSAPPPTVDGEGPSESSGNPPSHSEGRPTSELLTRAADVIDISAAFASALGYCNEDTGTQLDVFSAELRERAATFEAIEE